MRRSNVMMLLLFLGFGLCLHTPHATAADGPVLRHWHVGVQGVRSWRSRFDVFEATDLPPGGVDEYGHGMGFMFGRRFGGRFLLDLHLVYAERDPDGDEETLADFEALITGTVLFRQRETWQPFLRGGFGAGSTIYDPSGSGGNIYSYGATAIAGGGLQVRLSSRVALELETVATFTNFLEVHNEAEDPRWTRSSWQVRQSNHGWRVGMGIGVWF